MTTLGTFTSVAIPIQIANGGAEGVRGVVPSPECPGVSRIAVPL
jgi:hypothetical protein